jgi:hypothetical protein
MDAVKTKKISLAILFLVIGLIIPMFVTKPYYLHLLLCVCCGLIWLLPGIYSADLPGSYLWVTVFSRSGSLCSSDAFQ